MTFGTVKKKFEKYGFIQGDDGTDAIYVPSSFQRTTGDSFQSVMVGDRVQFEPIEGPKGMRAVTIRKVGQ